MCGFCEHCNEFTSKKVWVDQTFFVRGGGKQYLFYTKISNRSKHKNLN